jgi:hypothetical protein
MLVIILCLILSNKMNNKIQICHYIINKNSNNMSKIIPTSKFNY